MIDLEELTVRVAILTIATIVFSFARQKDYGWDPLLSAIRISMFISGAYDVFGIFGMYLAHGGITWQQ